MEDGDVFRIKTHPGPVLDMISDLVTLFINSFPCVPKQSLSLSCYCVPKLVVSYLFKTVSVSVLDQASWGQLETGFRSPSSQSDLGRTRWQRRKRNQQTSHEGWVIFHNHKEPAFGLHRERRVSYLAPQLAEGWVKSLHKLGKVIGFHQQWEE